MPLTHCNPTSSDYDKQCYGGSLRSDIDCQVFPNESGPLDLNFRNQVYFGQFRFISELIFSTNILSFSVATLLPFTLPFSPSHSPLPHLFSLLSLTSPSHSLTSPPHSLNSPPHSITVDAVFAVYEATSLELWSFFSYTAYDGAPSPVLLVSLYYYTMVFYLVIFVQVQTHPPIKYYTLYMWLML